MNQLKINRSLGPESYTNWLAANDGVISSEGYEFPLFSDAHIIGEIKEKLGPYQILNSLAFIRKPKFREAMILRVEDHVNDNNLETKYKDLNSTDVETYHGGTTTDEMAALISLTLGIRCKAGGATRKFDNTSGPKGRPQYHDAYLNPREPTNNWQGVILPSAVGNHNLSNALQIKKLPAIKPSEAISLIRAARLYQDGIWIAESETELSWLLLVSAIEVAAGTWRTQKESPTEKLQSSRPDLEKALEAKGGKKFVSEIAELIAPYMGATKTFVDFLLEFLPEPPNERPEIHYQVSWKKREMKKSLGTIYKLRSRALHGGVPFPFPMCYDPLLFGKQYAEKPLGMAALGSVWSSKDTPMHFHIFEYLVRKSLLNWWDSIAK